MKETGHGRRRGRGGHGDLFRSDGFDPTQYTVEERLFFFIKINTKGKMIILKCLEIAHGLLIELLQTDNIKIHFQKLPQRLVLTGIRR